MNLLFGLAVSAVLVGSPDPVVAVEADSGSVAFNNGKPALDLEDALALLQAEHHFSIAILLLDDPASDLESADTEVCSPSSPALR
jgi:hypothetical protein